MGGKPKPKKAAKSKPAANAKPKAKKPAAKAKPKAKSKPAAKAKPATKAKPVAKAKAKQARAIRVDDGPAIGRDAATPTPKSKSKSKPSPTPTPKSKPKPSPTPTSTSTSKSNPSPKPMLVPASPPIDQTPAVLKPRTADLGAITVPSGDLAIFDIGLMGYLPLDALAPMLVRAAVPADRPLRVVGERVGKGRFANSWDCIRVVLHADAPATHARKLGDAPTDFAQLVFADAAALPAWQHEDTLDGKADLLVWGRDAAPLARSIGGAPKVNAGYGWTNLALADAEAKWALAERLKSENKWLAQTELRRHTHHHAILEAARASPDGAGTLDVAGATLLLAFTTWGEGVFGIFAELDAADRAVAIRVQLAPPHS